MYKFSCLIFIIILSVASYAQHDVKWSYTNGYNNYPSTNTLQKSGGNNWNYAAFSYNKLQAEEDGSVNHTVANTAQSFFVGLTTSSSGNYTAIKFAANQNGTDLRIFEDGVYIKIISNILAVGDIVTVERTGANVYYSRVRAGVKTVYHTSNSPVNIYDELSAAICSFHHNSTLTNITSSFKTPINVVLDVTHIDLDNNIQGSINLTVTGPSSPYTYSWSNGATTEDLNNITQNKYTVVITDVLNNTTTHEVDVNYLVKWRDLVGTNYNSTTNTVLNNSYNSWCNSRGLSKNKLSAGINGYIEYEISATNMQMFLGFTTTSTSTCFHTIKHAIHQQNSNFIIYENGSKKFTSPGALQDGDIVRIQIDRLANEAHYTITRNGIETLSKTRTLLIPNNENTYADFRLYYTNASMSNVSCSFTYSNSIKYAELYSKLDGGYYKVEDDKLRFHYEEQYQDLDGILNYAVYSIGENTTIPLTSQSVTFGNNYYEVDLTSIVNPGYFMLEVTNEKKEKQYLKFYYNGYNPCPGCSAQ